MWSCWAPTSLSCPRRPRSRPPSSISSTGTRSCRLPPSRGKSCSTALTAPDHRARPCRCINIGATVAFLFLTNVALYGLGGLVPARFGFFASFAIPLAAFVLALAAFAAGRPWYTLAPPQGSVVADFLATLRAATRRSVVCCVQPHGASGCLPGRGCLLPLACGSLGLSFCAVVASFFLPAGPARDGAAIGGLGLILVGLVMLIGCGANTDWVRSAHADGARAAAEADAAAVVRILPLAACVVVFWMICTRAPRTIARPQPPADYRRRPPQPPAHPRPIAVSQRQRMPMRPRPNRLTTHALALVTRIRRTDVVQLPAAGLSDGSAHHGHQALTCDAQRVRFGRYHGVAPHPPRPALRLSSLLIISG